jgi:hypothetical protein
MESTSFRLQAKRIEEQAELIARLKAALAKSKAEREMHRRDAEEARHKQGTWKATVDDARTQAHATVARALRRAERTARHPSQTMSAYQRHTICFDGLTAARSDGIRFAMLACKAKLTNKNMKDYLNTNFSVRYWMNRRHMMVAFA